MINPADLELVAMGLYESHARYQDAMNHRTLVRWAPWHHLDQACRDGWRTTALSHCGEAREFAVGLTGWKFESATTKMAPV